MYANNKSMHTEVIIMEGGQYNFEPGLSVQLRKEEPKALVHQMRHATAPPPPPLPVMFSIGTETQKKHRAMTFKLRDQIGEILLVPGLQRAKLLCHFLWSSYYYNHLKDLRGSGLKEH